MWPFGWIGILTVGFITYVFGFVPGLCLALIGIFGLFVFPPGPDNSELPKPEGFVPEYPTIYEIRNLELRQVVHDDSSGITTTFNQILVRTDRISKWEE